MRIDCHIHGHPEKLSSDPKAYVQACRAEGIEAVVHIDPAPQCLAARELFGDFVLAVARINMDQDGVSDIDRHIADGCKGIKFIRPAAPYSDRRYWPLYEKLEQLGAVAVFHTGYLGFRRREENPAHMEYMRAAQIDVIARRFCDLKIMMAHFSNPWWEEAWKVAWANKNVYVDLSGGTAIARSLNMWTEMFAPNGQLHEPSFTKLCFGSDVSYFDQPEQLAVRPYVKFYDELLRRVGARAELVEKVNRSNVRMLFDVA